MATHSEGSIPEPDLSISVVVCTRNRARLLGDAIQSVISRGGANSAKYEILVVDDDSTDDTAEVVLRLAQANPQVRYTRCAGRGLLHARVTGQNQGRGTYIAYLDDDSQVAVDWLGRALRIIEERSPICFGGPFFPFYISKKPRWYQDEYGSMTHGADARDLNDDEYLCGGNIFFEAEALRASGGFDVNFCASDERWTYGDENLPQIRLRRAYPSRKFFYDPALSILHLVRPERLSIVRAARECFAMGRAYVKLTGVSKGARKFPYVWRFARSYLRFWFDALVGIWFRDRKQFPYAQNYIYESAFKELRGAAIFYQSIRVTRNLKHGGDEDH